MRVLGIHPSSESTSQIEDFKEQTGVSFPLLPDEGYSLGAIGFPPGVGFPYPRDVIVGKDLTIRAIRNSFDVDEVDALVQELLAE